MLRLVRLLVDRGRLLGVVAAVFLLAKAVWAVTGYSLNDLTAVALGWVAMVIDRVANESKRSDLALTDRDAMVPRRRNLLLSVAVGAVLAHWARPPAATGHGHRRRGPTALCPARPHGPLEVPGVAVSPRWGGLSPSR